MINSTDFFNKEAQKLMNLFNIKKFIDVIQKGNTLLRKYPESSFLFNLIGLSYKELGKFKEAKHYFLSSLKLDSNNIAALSNIANLFRLAGEFENSDKYFKRAFEIDPNHINTLLNYGNLKNDLNKNEEAIFYYKKAQNIDNENLTILYNLALAYQDIGDFDNAKLYFRNILKLNPKFTKADRMLSRISKYTAGDEHLIEMNNKIKNIDINKVEKIDLNFGLAKAYEDINDYKKSFEHIAEGNKLKKESINYNKKKITRLFDNIIKNFDNYDVEKNKINNLGKKIIFVLGLPRSGTSLVEQIISSHSKVYGSGELPYLRSLISKYFFKDGELDSTLIDSERFKKIQKEYFHFLDKYNIQEKIITDKAPLNFFWIGFIKSIFPNSIIIHCKRNLKDNSLSLYKNIFDDGLDFAYDLDDLLSFFNDYKKLMKFWEKKYPKTIYEISYENLISNTTKEIKELINFCELDWENNCLEHYKNKKTIRTVSAAQARKPIYKDSMNINKKFDPYLNIFFEKLNSL